MTDRASITGSRDDLAVDASRCLKMRYRDSRCQHCVDICPQGAVSLDGFLAVNPDHCSGCLLCTAVCPVGALEQNGDFPACLAQLSRVPEPVLGCIRTKEKSNATLSCLGGLSEEHLVSLCHSLEGTVTLNLSRCGDCLNNRMVSHLKQRLTALSAAGLCPGSCRIDLVEAEQEIHHRDESVDRRSFFRSFRASLVTSAAAIISTTHNGQTERRTEYGGKRIPLRRELLNRVRSGISGELSGLLENHFDSCISFEENCTRCQGCVAICPVGALQADCPDTVPESGQLLCTGCGLCQEFCLDSAIRISPTRTD